MDPAYRKAPKPAALPLALALALTLVFAVGGAQAQLIKDDEARKAIADLDQRFQSDQAAEATRVAARQAELAQLTEQLALLRKSVAEMAAEISRLQEEAVRLRAGRAETAQRIATLQRQHEQEQQALAARMAALEPATLQVDGQALRLPPQQARGYEEAMKHIKAADYDKAAVALAGFLRRFPGSPAAPSVRYWLGNALYPLKNFSEASAQFRALLANAPDHPLAPQAGLALANCQIEMKNLPAARKALEDVVRLYPTSEAAGTARERLALLR